MSSLTKLLTLILLVSLPFAATSQKKKKASASAETTAKADSAKAKTPTIKEKIASTRKVEGLFTLYQDTVSGSVQIFIKKDQLSKEFIYQSFSMGGPPQLFLNQNMLRETWVFGVRKTFDKIEFTRSNTNFYYDPANAISKSANVDVSETIFYSEKITAQDDKGYLIPGDGLFISEKLDPVRPFLPPTIPPGAILNLGTLNIAKSSYTKLRSFPKNTDVVVSLAYENPAPINFGGNIITDPRFIQVKMQHSFIELPKNDYRPRLDDPRVGYFTEQVDDRTAVTVPNYHDLIHRWHLVKKYPSQPLSEPVEPIVWWIENNTPLEVRSTILEAGLKWNEAFEKAGFQDAVQMKVMPDTASWDPSDIRYNVIRWVSSDLGYAIGPSFVNPRTGQILGADITIDFALLSGIMFEEETFTAFPGADYRAMFNANPHLAKHQHCGLAEGLQAMHASAFTVLEAFDAPEEEISHLKNQFLGFLILHEMGHTLGLNHNMKASQMLSPDELSNREITSKYGVAGSVMDYPIVNMTSDRAKQGDYYPFKPGPYDLWAIEFGYAPFEPEKEKDALGAILARSNEPKLTFGNDADITFAGLGVDPRVMVWDMSSDMVTYADDRFKLVNKSLGVIRNKFVKQGKSYEDLRSRYGSLFRQRYVMAAGVSRYIGGIYIDRSFPEQNSSSKPLTPVPVATQKRAMSLLSTYVFSPKAFDADAQLFPYLQRQRRGFNFFFEGTEDPKPQQNFAAIQSEVLGFILHPVTLERASNTTLYGNTYTPAEIMNDLVKACFNDDISTSVNLYRQNLQTMYVQNLISIFQDPTKQHGNSAKSSAYYMLVQLKNTLTIAKNTGDIQTRAHRSNLLFLIEKATSTR